MSVQSKDLVKVIVAPDHLKAWVRVNPGILPAQISRQHIVDAVKAAKIAWNEFVESRVDELFARLQSGEVPKEDWLVAEGRPPVQPVDAKFEWAERFRKKFEQQVDPDADRISHYERNTLITVQAGEPIGRIIPAQHGRPGVGVHGNELAVKKKPVEILLGENVTLGEDGQTVYAAVNGRVVIGGNKIWVDPVLEIPGDLDFSVGNIDASVDVHIKGSVKDLFRVKTTKNITVEQHVEAAHLEAGGDITVKGGIHGRQKAEIKAGGSIEAKICDSASIQAEGDLKFHKECIACKVFVRGKVVARSGTIIGGHVHARQAVEVQNIGSQGSVKTLISVGVPISVLEKAQKMASEAKGLTTAARKIRGTVEPLLREMRRLTPQQRERATELMFQADDLEAKAKDLEQRREEMVAAETPGEEPYVLVTGRLYSNVTIVISGRAATMSMEMKGPLKIVSRKMAGVTTLVAVDQVSGSATTLQTFRATSDLEERAAEYRAAVSAEAGTE